MFTTATNPHVRNRYALPGYGVPIDLLNYLVSKLVTPRKAVVLKLSPLYQMGLQS